MTWGQTQEDIIPEKDIIPEYKKQYTTELFKAPADLGGVKITVTGPLGAVAALIDTDFTNPGSVFNSLAVIGSFIPIPGISLVLGMIGSMFGGPAPDDLRQEQLMKGLANIQEGLKDLSLQINEGFNILLSAQKTQTITLQTFQLVIIQQEKLEQGTAYQFITEEIQKRSVLLAIKTVELHKETELKIDTIFADSIRDANDTVLQARDSWEIMRTTLRDAALSSIRPLILEASKKITSIDFSFLQKLETLKNLQDDINIIRFEYKLKKWLDPLIQNFMPQLQPMIGRTINKIDLTQSAPTMREWSVNTALDWPVIPTPTNIDNIINYKDEEITYRVVQLVDQLVGYIRLVFGL